MLEVVTQSSNMYVTLTSLNFGWKNTIFYYILMTHSRLMAHRS
jgi:hypothetical protein